MQQVTRCSRRGAVGEVQEARFRRPHYLLVMCIGWLTVTLRQSSVTTLPHTHRPRPSLPPWRSRLSTPRACAAGGRCVGVLQGVRRTGVRTDAGERSRRLKAGA